MQIYSISINRYNSFPIFNRKFNNLAPLQQDTVSFSSKPKTETKKPLIIEDLKDPVLDSIKDITKNHDCYIVGGYMRDYFNGKRNPHDWDLMCTDNSRVLASEIAEQKQGTFIPLDEERGIYRVVLKDKTAEFDIAQALENNVYLDSKRRDLTINSIFYNLNSHEVYDPFDGVSDVQNKIIRTSSLDNMKNDPLRMLRVYRFTAKTGFSIDEKLSAYCRENFPLIKRIAPERINCELMNIFSAENCESALSAMLDDGALTFLFNSIKGNENQLRKTIENLSLIPKEKPTLKLATLLVCSTVPTEEIVQELKKLKFTKKQISYIQKLIENKISPEALNSKRAFAEIIKSLGDDTQDAILLAKVRFNDTNFDKLEEHFQEIKEDFPEFKPLLNGKEIAKILGIKPSKQTSDISNEILLQQLMGTIKTREEAMNYLQSIKEN